MSLSEWAEYVADNRRIRRLVTGGHSEHCARRLVWGDGYCECARQAADD